MFFDHVPEGPPDPVFGLTSVFQSDPRPQKVNLLVGIFKDEHLRSELLPTVRKAKERILGTDILADYLPMDGIQEFAEAIGALVFGEELWKENRARIYGAQTAGGTGALRVGAEFLTQEVGRLAAISHPTWPNHRMIFERAGATVSSYDYYSRGMKGFDFAAMEKCLEALPEKTVVVLHGCCHNPTGCDPTPDEWKAISQILKRKKLLPFFDLAYQGLGDGMERDAAPIRAFLQEGHEMLIAYSCSKNFSLYCQRVGALFVVGGNAAGKTRIGSQVKRVIRALYSNPPAHGANIVLEILKDSELKKGWLKDLEGMRHRLVMMREALIQRLSAGSKKIDFSYLKKHKGMFSYVDLDKSQTQQLIDRFGIYLLDSGRINVAGLTAKNLGYVAENILTVCGA